ncbi:MAG: hypothetical protein AAGI44_07495 [Pseudomonadota bacterium]
MKPRARAFRKSDQCAIADINVPEAVETIDAVDIVLEFPLYAAFMTSLFFTSVGAAFLLFTV